MPNLLLVEDDSCTAEVLQSVLNEHFSVDFCEDGSQAMQRLATKRYDLILTDIIMPRVDGIELILHCKKNYPYLKVVAMSGHHAKTGEMSYLEMALTFGAHLTFSKPFALSSLELSLKGLLIQ